MAHRACAHTAALGLFLCGTVSARAQQDSAVRIEPVIVTVTRGTRSVLGSPFAISIIRPDSARPGQRKTAVDEILALVPGVTAVNRNNPAQDPRLSIRGFGARSTFGVRGVRVLRDGMPLTLPDGQTPLDYLDLESVGRIEVMRGAASAMYGNASGGVIDMRTAAPSAAALSVEPRQWLGENGWSRSVIGASGTVAGFGYVSDVAHTRSDGERNHSRQRATTGFARVSLSRDAGDVAITAMALDNPLSENPGALTLEEMRSDATVADALSLRRKARKAVKQVQIGLSADRALEFGMLSVAAFAGARSLDNPLTFAIVEIGRHTYGTSASLQKDVGGGAVRHRFSAGVDGQWQNDLRRNYATCADTVPLSAPTPTCPYLDTERGVVTLDQRELVSGAGAYIADEISLTPRLSVTAGLRGDKVTFEVRDRLVTNSNPDDSGERSLGAVSPIAGIVARVSPTHSLYANLSAAFETPTATELGNNADGTAGINQDLEPQRSTTVEAGAKGWAGSSLRYDLAFFDTRVRDELVPFEIPASNGRRYFRNAGRTRRRGAEAGADISAGPATLLFAYSYSHFRFEDYSTGGSDFSGKEIPGLPAHRLQAALRVGSRLAFALLETETAGDAFVDDANSVRAPGYTVAHSRVGGAPFRRLPRLSITVGIQNIFDRRYASSIAVNAARGKYYEPAQGRALYAGVSLGGSAAK
ncbi:MAG: TonB-dependent receptor [Gemmatimonadales bacterium]